jgi:hypothetical protein
MKQKLKKLAEFISTIDSDLGDQINALAGRYDKSEITVPFSLQPAYDYIMYLKLMRGLNTSAFHHMKRKYLDTSNDVQDECKKELEKMIMEDAVKFKIPSSEIRKNFKERVKKFNSLS